MRFKTFLSEKTLNIDSSLLSKINNFLDTSILELEDLQSKLVNNKILTKLNHKFPTLKETIKFNFNGLITKKIITNNIMEKYNKII